jgi:hypothetical protein
VTGTETKERRALQGRAIEVDRHTHPAVAWARAQRVKSTVRQLPLSLVTGPASTLKLRAELDAFAGAQARFAGQGVVRGILGELPAGFYVFNDFHTRQLVPVDAYDMVFTGNNSPSPLHFNHLVVGPYGVYAIRTLHWLPGEDRTGYPGLNEAVALNAKYIPQLQSYLRGKGLPVWISNLAVYTGSLHFFYPEQSGAARLVGCDYLRNVILGSADQKQLHLAPEQVKAIVRELRQVNQRVPFDPPQWMNF